MKDLLIVGNWKENKTLAEAKIFINDFAGNYMPRLGVTVVVCPAYLQVPEVSAILSTNNISAVNIGVQDLSEFEGGAHTGEVSPRQVAEFAKYSIIGHSERRAAGQTDEDVSRKVDLAFKNNIVPIVCVVNENVPIPKTTKIVAYEPIEAIGTGRPDNPVNANEIARQIRIKNPNVETVLYGGSVTSGNVKSFTDQEFISGVLVGTASLEAREFSSIIKNA